LSFPDLERIPERLRAVGGSFVGVGVTAFSRAGLAGILPGYQVVCLRETSDLSILRRSMEVFCLEEALDGPVDGPEDSLVLLSHPATRHHLSRLPQPVHLLLYQSYAELETLAKSEGWHLLANPAALRVRVGDRAFFHQAVLRLGLPAIPGALVSLERFLERNYEEWVRDLGPRLVIQLPDVLRGGGRSTFFIDTESRFTEVRGLLRSGWWQGRRVHRVSVRERRKGQPASVAACITQEGVHVSPLQRQIIDPPWISGVLSNGVFGGHSWGGPSWPEAVERQARAQARAMARVLASMGYRGLFGLDLLVDPEEGAVIPVELNPRLTGAFPVLTRLQAAQGVVPLELLHALSLLDPEAAAPVRVSDDETPSAPLRGGHLVLFRGEGRRPGQEAPPRPGIYAREQPGRAIRWAGEGWDTREIRGPDRFIFVEGPSVSGRPGTSVSGPLDRVGRLIFGRPVIGADGRLDPATVDAAAHIMDLIP